jgi:protein involved in polysaccharide export with SLBB domain
LPLLTCVLLFGPVSGVIVHWRKVLEERYGTLYSDPVVEVVTNVNINITGAVRESGQFFVPPSATLVDVLARAGGVTSEIDIGVSGGASDPSQVRLVRNGVATVIDASPPNTPGGSCAADPVG